MSVLEYLTFYPPTTDRTSWITQMWNYILKQILLDAWWPYWGTRYQYNAMPLPTGNNIKADTACLCSKHDSKRVTSPSNLFCLKQIQLLVASESLKLAEM